MIFGISIPTVTIAALSLVTFLHMALGEQAPKSLAIRAPRLLVLLTAPPLVILSYVFSPVIWLLNKASNLTLVVLGLGQTSTEELAHSEEELRLIVAESVAGGHLSRNERMMIENVLNLEEKTARRVMIPRPDIVYLSLARPLEDNLRLARQAGHTRFPLCEDDLSTVIGMIHVKDIFRSGSYQNGRTELRQLARKIPFLPVTLRLDQLLLEFQRNRIHLAMLLDEYGSVVGMVTLENVLEELVGPIQDEFDRETPPITPVSENVYEIDAACPLDVLAETCGIEIPETDAETVGGLVLDRLGRLAKTGDSVTINAHRLMVIQADPTRIRKIRLEPYNPEATAGATGRGRKAGWQIGKRSLIRHPLMAEKWHPVRADQNLQSDLSWSADRQFPLVSAISFVIKGSGLTRPASPDTLIGTILRRNSGDLLLYGVRRYRFAMYKHTIWFSHQRISQQMYSDWLVGLDLNGERENRSLSLRLAGIR